MYRLSVRIGTTFTSARCERAGESEVLRLSPIARDLPSASFVTSGRVQVDLLAETLRGIDLTGWSYGHLLGSGDSRRTERWIDLHARHGRIVRASATDRPQRWQ